MPMANRHSAAKRNPQTRRSVPVADADASDAYVVPGVSEQRRKLRLIVIGVVAACTLLFVAGMAARALRSDKDEPSASGGSTPTATATSTAATATTRTEPAPTVATTIPPPEPATTTAQTPTTPQATTATAA